MFFSIKFLFKFLIYFSISYIILSVPIGDRPLFYYIHTSVEPHIRDFLIKGAKDISRSEQSDMGSVKASSEVAKKFFSNTLPEEIDGDPQINQQPKGSPVGEHDDESYTIEERQFLKKILDEKK